MSMPSMSIVRMTEKQKKLVEDNIQLVGYTMHEKFNRIYHDDDDDMYQVGCMGLCKAAIVFDENRNVKFSTFAVWCIFHEMIHYIERKNGKKQQVFNDAIRFESIDIDDDRNFLCGIGNSTDALDRLFVEDINRIIENEFSGKDRDCLRLLASGVHQAEIGRIMGVTREAIRRRVNRVKKRFRTKYPVDIYGF